MSDVKWTRSNGETVSIKTMNTGHLRSAIAMMKKNGFISASDYSLFETDREADNAVIAEMKPSTLLDALESELLERSKENEPA